MSLRREEILARVPLVKGRLGREEWFTPSISAICDKRAHLRIFVRCNNS